VGVYFIILNRRNEVVSSSVFIVVQLFGVVEVVSKAPEFTGQRPKVRLLRLTFFELEVGTVKLRVVF